ncbi:MAG: hypothetical protein WEC84_01460 [Candidatus Andersenbacteria bacterium]
MNVKTGDTEVKTGDTNVNVKTGDQKVNVNATGGSSIVHAGSKTARAGEIAGTSTTVTHQGTPVHVPITAKTGPAGVLASISTIVGGIGVVVTRRFL